MKNSIKYRFTLLSIVIVITLAGISGCKKTNASPPAFMQVGHEWKYLEGFAGGGYDTLMVTITGMDDEKEYVVSYKHTNGDSLIEYWYMDGNYVKKYPQGYTNLSANIFWEVNPVAGDKWNSPSLDSLGVTQYGVNQYDQVLGLNFVDTTFAGVFSTTKLQVSNSSNNQFEYYFISNDAGQIAQTGLYTLNLLYKNF